MTIIQENIIVLLSLTAVFGCTEQSQSAAAPQRGGRRYPTAVRWQPTTGRSAMQIYLSHEYLSRYQVFYMYLFLVCNY